MDNIFNKKSVGYGTRMILKDGRRSFVRDSKYFISMNIFPVKPAVTICGASNTQFINYAVLNSYGVMIQGGEINGSTVSINMREIPKSKYIMLCGKIDDIDKLMLVDEGIDYVPSYIDYKGNSSSGGSQVVEKCDSVFTSSKIEYNPDTRVYTIEGLDLGDISSFDDLPDTFVSYVTFDDGVHGPSKIELLGHEFTLSYNDGTAVSEYEDVPSVTLALLFEKESSTVKLPY